MHFNKHLPCEGQHAFLGASSYHWLNYSPEKLAMVWQSEQAKRIGTELHAFACSAISMKQRLRGSTQTLSMYVNDAIGYHMTPEVVLYYSRNCFGTADAISFTKDRDGIDILRIHDLKTGSCPAKMDQLRIYAALFCLEYNHDPKKIKMELRIYQNDDVILENPNPDVIIDIMHKIRESDDIIEKLRAQEE